MKKEDSIFCHFTDTPTHTHTREHTHTTCTRGRTHTHTHSRHDKDININIRKIKKKKKNRYSPKQKRQENTQETMQNTNNTLAFCKIRQQPYVLFFNYDVIINEVKQKYENKKENQTVFSFVLLFLLFLCLPPHDTAALLCSLALFPYFCLCSFYLLCRPAKSPIRQHPHTPIPTHTETHLAAVSHTHARSI